MNKGTPPKTNRNNEIYEMKKHATFRELAEVFNIHPSRVAFIYYRERRRRRALAKKNRG